MSNKTVFNPTVLGAVLAVQVIVAAIVFWPSASDTVEVEPLLAVEQEAINRMELRSPEGTIALRKQGDTWQLGNGLPVQQSQVESLMSKLAELKTGWPAGTTVESHERYKVTDADFMRRLELYTDDTQLAQVYLGSAVNLRQTHARVSGDDNVYAVNIAAFELPTTLNSWLETTLLQPQGDITEVRAGAFSVTKTDGSWPQADAGAEQATESVATDASSKAFDVQSFAQTLNNLRVNGVADNLGDFDAEEAQGATQEPGALSKIEFVVTTADATHQYELLSKDDEYYIRRDDFKATFKIGKVQYDKLVSIAQASV